MANNEIADYGMDDIADYSDNNLLGIRVSPTSVLGELGPKGQVLCAREVIDNSVDEHVKAKVAVPIKVWIHEYRGGYEIKVLDFGRGIPPEGLEIVATKLYTSAKQGGTAYGGATAGTFGIGLVASAAASRLFYCIAMREGEYAKIAIEEGNTKEYIHDTKMGFTQSGTYTFIQSDPKIFEDCDEFIGGEGEKRLMEFLHFISAVSPKHLQIEVYKSKGRRTTIKDLLADTSDVLRQFEIPPRAQIIFKTNPDDTMKEYVQQYYGIRPENTLFDITELKRELTDTGDMGFNVSFVVANNMRAPVQVMSAVNRVFMRLQTSDHITVFLSTIKEMVLPYIDDEDIGIFFRSQYRLPIYPSILVNLREVKFVGASKEGFKSNKFRDRYRNALIECFNTLPEKWEELHEVLKDDIDTKYKAFSKTIVRHKGLNNVFEHLNKPKNYKGCRSKDSRIIELFLTEGNSAGDALKTSRDSTTQALYYLMGKPVNALQKSKYDADEIYQDLKQLIGVESHDATLDNMSFNKVLILADADADGLHITTLLISIFYKINPLIISEGRVAICNPPLYSFSVGNKTLFMRDENARRDMLIKLVYAPALDIFIQTGDTVIKLEGDSYRDLCYMVLNVGTRIENAAKIVTMDPSLMELFAPVVELLNPDKIDIKGLQEYIELPLSYNEIDKAIIIDMQDGSEKTIPINNLYAQLKEEVCPVLDSINAKYFNLSVTTKQTDYYEDQQVTFVYLLGLFKLLDKQAIISRFKGIGQLNPDQIGHTCVSPATRSIINIYAIGDVEKIMAYLGEDPSIRKSIIENVDAII